jgi:MFS family permease
VALAAIYFVFMVSGALGYRVPPDGWAPKGWTPPAPAANALVTHRHVHLDVAWKTPQFWLLWGVLCLNVSAGIGVLGMASPMLQEVFGGKLIGVDIGYDTLTADQKKQIAAIAAGFTGLLSLCNIGGRIGWASASDTFGRKGTYAIFFVLGLLLYGAVPFAAKGGIVFLFVLLFAVIITMYGGGFATIPAYLADIFGTHFVGAIHGRLLTAWSTAGVLGPVLVNYIREYQLSIGVPREAAYNQTMYVLAGLLVVGLICNLLVRPVDEKYYMTDEEVAATKKTSVAAVREEEKEPHADFEDYVEDALEPETEPAVAIRTRGNGAFSPVLLLAWAAVGIPLAWGVSMTVIKALALFH